MLFLVNDILDFAQFENNNIQLHLDQVFDIREVIKECISILTFRAESKRIQLVP